MKRLIVGVFVASLLLVGCGTKLQTNPTDQVPYVAFYSSANPPLFYKLTTNRVKNVGGYLQDLNTNPNVARSTGPASWTSDIKNRKIEIREIVGVSSRKAVAIQYVHNGPFYEAVIQKKEP